MNEKELSAHQKKLMSGATGTMKLGIVTGVGSTVIGAMGAGNPAAQPAVNASNAALGLAAVGNLAAVGMSIMPEQKTTKKPVVKKQPVKKGTPMSNPAAYF